MCYTTNSFWTGQSGRCRLFVLVSFYIFVFFCYVCQIKLTTLSFSVHVKVFYRVVS